MRITISPKWPIVLLASALLLACDARPRTSSGVSRDLDTLSTYCGDGVLALGIETCDDGNTVDNDDCTNLCRSPNSSDTLIDLARAASKAGLLGSAAMAFVTGSSPAMTAISMTPTLVLPPAG